MSMIKYAKAESQILSMGSLKDLVEAKDTSEAVIRKVASFIPIANHLDDYIYIRHRAISALEHFGANGNHDGFPKDELMKSYATFVNTGFFKDHDNDDPKKAYGLNLDAYYHPKHFIVLLTAVSRKMQGAKSEEMVRNILANKWNQTSMGAAVGWSECNHCHNKATDPKEYCDHIRLAKGMVIDGIKVIEINHDLEFFEDSNITTEAADVDARVAEIYLPEEVMNSAVTAEVLAGDITKHIRMPHIKYKKSAAKNQGTNVSTVVPSPLEVTEGGITMSKPVVAEAKRPDETSSEQFVAPKDQASQTDVKDLSRQKQTVNSSGKDDKTSPQAVAEDDQVSQKSDADQNYGQSVQAKQKFLTDLSAMLGLSSPQTVEADKMDPKDKAADEAAKKKKEEAEKKADDAKKEAAKKDPKTKMNYKKDKKGKSPKKAKAGIQAFFSALSNVLGVAGEEGALDELSDIAGPPTEGGETADPEEELRNTIDLVKQTQDAVDMEKQQILSKLKKAVLASTQRRIQADLNELQQAETTLVEVKHDLELMLQPATEGEGPTADAVEMAVQEANDAVTQALDLTDGGENGEDGEEASTPDIAEVVSKLRAKAGKKITAEEGDEMPGSPAGKAEAGNPQNLPASKDYGRGGDLWASYKSEIDSANSKTEGQIKSQRETGFATPEERQSMADKLKTAGKGGRRIRLYTEADAAVAEPAVAGTPSPEELNRQIADQTSTKLVDRIFQSNPAGPEAAAGAAEVGQPPSEPANDALFGTPPKSAARKTKADLSFGEDRGQIESDETSGSKLPSSDDPADEGNDLFPEESVTSAAREANSEQQSQLSQDLRAVFVPTAPGKQIDPKGIYPTAASLESRISEALSLAQQLVDSGLAQEADLESESKRLFRMSPDELKGVTAVLKTAAKRKSFAHPDEGRGMLTSAIHFGSGGVFGEGERDNAVLFDDDMALF